MATLALYPGNSAANFPGLGFNVKWSPVFFNQSVKTLTGASIDIGLAQYPLHNFELTYPFMRDYGNFGGSTEFKVMMGFWMAVNGALGRFHFQNPDDFAVTNGLIAVGDGTTSSYTIIHKFGPSPFPLNSGAEPIGDLDNGFTPNVYYNGVLKTVGTDYTLDETIPGSNFLNLITIPPALTLITMDFHFFYYCKFSEDSLTCEKWVNQIWMGQSVKLQTCRPRA
jgi:hypothetical protein